MAQTWLVKTRFPTLLHFHRGGPFHVPASVQLTTAPPPRSYYSQFMSASKRQKIDVESLLAVESLLYPLPLTGADIRRILFDVNPTEEVRAQQRRICGTLYNLAVLSIFSISVLRAVINAATPNGIPPAA